MSKKTISRSSSTGPFSSQACGAVRTYEKDGDLITEYGDKSIDMVLPDGRRIVRYPDQSFVVVHPDGKSQSYFPIPVNKEFLLCIEQGNGAPSINYVSFAQDGDAWNVGVESEAEPAGERTVDTVRSLMTTLGFDSKSFLFALLYEFAFAQAQTSS